MNELKNISQDVKRRVDFAVEQDFQCTNQVKGWLESVEAMEEGVNQILQKGNEEIQNKCLGSCPKNYWSSYALGKGVAKKLDAVRKLVGKGQFETVAHKLQHNFVGEMPVEKTLGLDLTLLEVWRCIRSENVGIIGLYGMGGVGKTTLLKRINNEFFGTRNDFDVVIWVVASKEASISKIQDAIQDRLQIPDDEWKSNRVEERSITIYRTLRGKKFVLLLDDVWKQFDLLKVGVPIPDIHNGSKVIFTTRSKEVCGQMEADKCIRVECLEQEKALDLFLEKVGEEALSSHPTIPHLAKAVAEECKGLPLALITVGRSMASRKKLEDWERAIELLRSYPSNFSGIVDCVYHLLEFSYDSLPNATTQSCFLYCSLFPKGSSIRKTRLIDLWIGEGFLDEFDDIHDARKQGEEVIWSLKLVCLLESGESEEFVKMHDVIRDMALWLACERGQKKNKYLVKESVRPAGANKFVKWKEAERISLWGQDIRNLDGVMLCPKVVTLLVTGTFMGTFPSELFESMHALAVLDFSGNESLTSLPKGIGNLRNLQYLNLSGTALRALPVEIKNLKKLKCLLLNDTYSLIDIPREVMSSLPSLQVFSRLQSPSHMNSCPQYDERALLEELEFLGLIEDICITIFNSLSVQKLLNSSKLHWCIRNLTIVWCFTSFNISTSSLSRLEYMETLEIWNANPLRIDVEQKTMQGSLPNRHIPSTSRITGLEQMRNLRVLVVVQCEMLEMNWLIYAQRLQTLQVIDCLSIREVLSDGSGEEIRHENRNAFSCLTTIHLQGLPRLKNISLQALALPLLKEIEVLNCPSLEKLPFDSNTSAKESLTEIRGQRDWWDKLLWDDEIVRNVFSSRFVSLDGISMWDQDSPPTLSLPLIVSRLPSLPPT
ncbi:disease resistance protein SUMM2 [Morus notabilis]|nr:disease resistance protein SUMM2 [Morus notabilis]